MDDLVVETNKEPGCLEYKWVVFRSFSRARKEARPLTPLRPFLPKVTTFPATRRLSLLSNGRTRYDLLAWSWRALSFETLPIIR